MRTNIEIDDKLMKAAMKATGKSTKRETVEEALRRTIEMETHLDIRKLRGKLHWEGSLEEMRLDR